MKGKSKRILLVSPFPPNIGGVSISVQRLFDRLIFDGFEVDKFDIRFINNTFNKFQLLKLLRFLSLPIWILLKPKYDIIHFHVSGNLLKSYVSSFRYLFSKKTKFIITIHGDIKDLIKHRNGLNCLRGFDTIICVKQGDKSLLSHLKDKEILEIPAYIAPAENSNYQLPIAILSFLKNDCIKIIINGAIICNKSYSDLYGFMDALILIKSLRDEGFMSKLLVINLGNRSGMNGDLFHKESLKFIETNKLGEVVLWYDVDVPLDFFQILKKSDIFIRPTKTDGDALSLREALSLNIPSVASNAVIRPTGTILYNYGDSNDLKSKIVQIINNYNEHKLFLNNRSSIDYYTQIKELYENNKFKSENKKKQIFLF